MPNGSVCHVPWKRAKRSFRSWKVLEDIDLTSNQDLLTSPNGVGKYITYECSGRLFYPDYRGYRQPYLLLNLTPPHGRTI